LGAGRFEIGATDVFNLIAQSTSHLVMDLPATGFFGQQTGSGENLLLDHGIDVEGSLHGQNLLQGSSGVVAHDIAFGLGVSSTFNDAYFGAVADDSLTGGPSLDEYFPEGGTDTINLNSSNSLVWFGFYDVGYSGAQETGTVRGPIFEQAITDFTSTTGTAEQFVDGYGTSLLTINNFVFGSSGDEINFGTSDWASLQNHVGTTPGTGVQCSGMARLMSPSVLRPLTQSAPQTTRRKRAPISSWITSAAATSARPLFKPH
jgi:hypothetical protein